MTPQRRKNIYKLSPTQEGTLFHATASNSDIDVEQIVCSIDEPLAVETLKLAWRKIVDRHEALRTSFHAHKNDGPYQQVHLDIDLPWNFKDLRALSATQQETELNHWLRQDREAGFELESAPLSRLNLFRLGDQKWTLVWTFHRATLDSRSLSVVLTEVFRTYDAALRKEALDLPAVRPYSDYTEFLYTLDNSQAEKYWRKTLRDFARTNALAKLESRNKEAGYAEQEIQLSTEVTQALGDLAIRERFTVNNAVQAAWALALGRYSNTADVIFGATRPCRGFLPRAGSMVGKFGNTLPVRVKLGDELSVFELLRQVRATEIAIRDYEHTPLARIQSWSELPAESPLFESVLVFDHAPLDAQMKSPYLNWTNRQVQLLEHTGCPVTLYTYAEPALTLRLAYDRSRFGQAHMQLALGHLQTLLEEIAKGDDLDASYLQKLIPQDWRLPAGIKTLCALNDRILGRVEEKRSIHPASAPIPQFSLTPAPVTVVPAPVMPAALLLAAVAPTPIAVVEPVVSAPMAAAPPMAPALLASLRTIPAQAATLPFVAAIVAPAAVVSNPIFPAVFVPAQAPLSLAAPAKTAKKAAKETPAPVRAAVNNAPVDQELWKVAAGEETPAAPAHSAPVPNAPKLVAPATTKPSVIADRQHSAEPFAWATEPVEVPKPKKQRRASGSVLRDLLKGAKDAATTATSVKTYLTAPSALRDLLKNDHAQKQTSGTFAPASTLRGSSLVPIQPNGEKPTIFCIAALDGDMTVFHTLSAGLGNDQPMYGLDPSSIANDPETRTSVKRIARYYIDQLRAAGQERPYCLMGDSFGGLVALEMSQQLAASGAEVPATILVNTHYPAGCRTHEKLSARVHRYTHHLQQTLKRNPAGAQSSIPVMTEQPTLEMPKNEQSAADHYRARPYAGRACILKASTPLPVFDGGPKAGWDGIFNDNVSIFYEIPGDNGIINTNKHAGLMVRRLNEFLRGVDEARVVPVFSRIAS